MEDETDPPREETPVASGSEFAGAPEISRRVSAILDAVELEAQRLREEAREEAARYLEQAKVRADGLVAERQRRIAVVSDELLAKAEAVAGRLDDAAPVRAGFENLVRALGDAAERLARETQRDGEFEPQPFHASTARPEPPAERAPVAAQPSGFAQPHPARAPTRPYPG
jgi:cell division septum initiation protein DivIVA